MKNILTIIICLTIAFAFANEPQSMQNVASDGVFSGAWEDVYDPIDLNKINKFYFFTNLADFNYTYNEMYGGIGENSRVKFLEELPLGTAFINPFQKNLRHSFFIRLRNNLTPDYLDSGNMGDFEEYVTTYEDITGDDIYDIKTITHLHKQGNYENDKLFDFIWNNNYQMNGLNLGFKFSSFVSTTELDNAQSSLGEYDFGNYGLINGFWGGHYQEDMFQEFYELGEEDYYFRYSEKGDFVTKIKDNQKKFLFSVETDNNLLINDSSLRFDLGMNLCQDLSSDTNDKYNGSYSEIITVDSLVNSGIISETFKRKIERNETDFFLSTLLKKELMSTFEGENGFYETGLGIGYISGDKEEFMRNNLESEEILVSLNSMESTTFEVTDNMFYVDEKGDLSGIHFNSHFLANLPLNDYSIFGFGGYYKYSNTSGNFDYVSEILNIESYQIGSEIDTETEYTETESEYLSADKQTIFRSSTLRIPIAIEFKIPENHTSQNDGFGLRNFVFRLGSTFNLKCTEEENTYDVIESNPNLIFTEYGDGTITEYHDAENELNSNKEIIKYRESNKRFSGGIGYQHSDNLSIDLGGYYNHNTENYFIGISFTINR